jgi:hypothetical protein
MSVEEYLRLMDAINQTSSAITSVKEDVKEGVAAVKTVKKKTSAYNRKYKAAFKKIASKYKLKSGKWKKGGFKAAVKAAHKAVKK